MNPQADIRLVRDRLLEDGVILCVRMREGDPILDACRAAARGGLRVFEITLTTPGALDVISTLAADQDLLVGAGTVLSGGDVETVAEAGARFALSPVFDPEVVDQARARGLLAVPGASTPREILDAHRHGATLVKVFPAGPLGGAPFLRALRGPLPDIDLIPTSGPTSQNVAEYVAAGAVAVGVGAEIFGAGFDEAEIERAASRVRRAMDRARSREP
jgi:2-dehydro-3-deoxyphosphogluconate aldolase/(4S)-4-hydroxy-2-oxoglutarate aldolase